jgi:hypothetical protein
VIDSASTAAFEPALLPLCADFADVADGGPKAFSSEASAVSCRCVW